MLIGLNGQRILIDNPAGPERFTIDLYKAIALEDKANTYILYLNQEPSQNFINELFNNNKNFSYKVIKVKKFWTQLGLAHELLKNPVDVFFSPIHTLPFFRHPKTKFIVMIHGLEYLTNQQFKKYSPFKLWQAFITRWVITNANSIVVPSMATLNAINKNPKAKIIYEGVDQNFRPRKNEEVESKLQNYNIKPKGYLLFVSTIQPRKNVINLIRAYAALERKYRTENKLILVGKLGWNYTDILNAPEKYEVTNDVKFLNWVPQNDIYNLFSGATGYVNFSFDEGFGLTVLEAMASGVPVAASDIPAHREVGNETITYANPDSIEDITQKMKNIITHQYDDSLIDKAIKQSQNFSWKKAATETIKLFNGD